MLNFLVEVYVQLAPVQISDQGSVEDLNLLHGANVLDAMILFILFYVTLVLINYLFLVKLLVQINFSDCLTRVGSLNERLEGVCVLTEGLLALSEVDLDVGNIAYLVCGENTEDALLAERLELATLEFD